MTNSKGKIKISFDQPTNGWTKMEFESENYKLVDVISDVPNDPIEELLVSVRDLFGPSKHATVSFHLEPEWYYFDFKKVEKDTITINIHYSRDSSKPKDLIHTVTGTKNEILMPIYRALCKFYAYEFKENSWEAIESKRLLKFKAFVKEKSA